MTQRHRAVRAAHLDLHERFRAVVARALARPVDSLPAAPVSVRDDVAPDDRASIITTEE